MIQLLPSERLQASACAPGSRCRCRGESADHATGEAELEVRGLGTQERAEGG